MLDRLHMFNMLESRHYLNSAAAAVRKVRSAARAPTDSSCRPPHSGPMNQGRPASSWGRQPQPTTCMSNTWIDPFPGSITVSTRLSCSSGIETAYTE